MPAHFDFERAGTAVAAAVAAGAVGASMLYLSRIGAFDSSAPRPPPRGAEHEVAFEDGRPEALPVSAGSMVLRRRFARIDGQRIHFVDDGDADAPLTVLLVHGNPTWSFLWRKVIKLLRQQCKGSDVRIVAPDLFGFGLSDKDEDIHSARLTPEYQVQLVVSLVKALGCAKILVVGQDWGGPIAACVAARLREKVCGAAFGNTALRVPTKPSKSWFHRVSHMPIVSDLLFRFGGFPLSSLDGVQGDPSSIRGPTAAAYRDVFASWRQRSAPLAFARAVPRGPSDGAVEVLREAQEWIDQFSGKTALSWGEKDPVLGHLLRSMRRQLPNLVYCDVHRGGHFLQEDAASSFAAAIESLIRQDGDASELDTTQNASGYRVVLRTAKAFASSDVVVRFGRAHNRDESSEVVETEIAAEWARRLASSQRMFNASKFRFAGSRTEGRSVVLDLGLTDYRSFVGTQLSRSWLTVSKTQRAETLSNGVIVETADGHIVMIQRSSAVAEAQGLVVCPGGHAEPERARISAAPEDIEVHDGSSAIVREFFDSAIEEVVDETGIPRASLSPPRFIGIVRRIENARLVAFFVLTCDMSIDQVSAAYLEHHREDSFESTQILFCPTEDVINDRVYHPMPGCHVGGLQLFRDWVRGGRS